MGTEFLLLCILIFKHWLCDFPLQRHPFLYSHKGKYGHPGGYAHAAIHGLLTFLVLMPFVQDFVTAGAAFAFDAVVHYHIDYLKASITKRMGWSGLVGEVVTEGRSFVGTETIPLRRTPAHLAIFSQNYFEAIGLDQLAHYVTYVVIVAAAL